MLYSLRGRDPSGYHVPTTWIIQDGDWTVHSRAWSDRLLGLWDIALHDLIRTRLSAVFVRSGTLGSDDDHVEGVRTGGVLLHLDGWMLISLAVWYVESACLCLKAPLMHV